MPDDDKRFTLLPDHVKLLRKANVRWEAIETGAPAIDGKRPYGNSDVPRDIAEILEWEGAEAEVLDENLRARAMGLHSETETALQVILATGTFMPGTYVADRYGRNWRLVDPGAPQELRGFREELLDSARTFCEARRGAGEGPLPETCREVLELFFNTTPGELA